MGADGMRRRELFGAAWGAGIAGAIGVAAPALAAEEAKEWRDLKKRATVFGTPMAYYEVGEGRPIIFLHGNPTSSYLWRKVIPHVQHLGRCIAPDMVGMGDSGRLPNSGPGVYTYKTHRRHMFELFRRLGVERDIVFVIHDWGTGLGFDFAHQNPGAVRGLAYGEAILHRPDEPPYTPKPGNLFDSFLTPEGERLVLQDNVFVENLLIGGLKYFLTPADEAEYRRPYLTPGESRRPTLEWPRELPRYSAETREIVKAYTAWLPQTQIPKLFLHASPGAILANPELLKYVRTFPNQTEAQVYGTHYLQEVSGDAIGRALSEWLGKLA
jgi:haloalkane dehalogenase